MRLSYLVLALSACASSTETLPGSGDAAMNLMPPPDLSQPIIIVHPDMAVDVIDMAMVSNATACNSADETIGPEGGPDACTYGARCDSSTMTCLAPPDGSCAMATGAPQWDSAARQAPVISSVSATLLASTNSSTECAGGSPAALVTVGFYTPNALTTMSDTIAFEHQIMWKKSSSATGSWYPGTFIRMMPTANAHFGTFQVGINCGGAGGTDRTAALYVMDESMRVSNTVCVTWQ